MLMDFPNWVQSMLSSATPVLPGDALLHVALPLAWAIVLVCGVLYVGRQWTPRLRFGLAVMLGVVTLSPGQISPSFWLGLAFQIPSLMTLLVCIGFCMGTRTGTGTVTASTRMLEAGWLLLSAVGMALGWVLLLDTLALLPFSLYHWGFSPIALVVVALLACVPWLAAGLLPSLLKASLLVLGVLALFVLTRLPSGNLWDALIDPWLWAALQVGWLRRGWRYLSVVRASRRAPPATRG